MNRETAIRRMSWLLSGALFGISFLHPLLWWLFIPAIVLWLSALYHSRTLPQAMWGSWAVGAGKASGAILWFWHTYPMDWSGIGSASLQLSLIGVYWTVTSVAIGSGMIVAGVSMYALRHVRWQLLAFPLLLVASEVLGSLLFSLYSLGPGAVPNIHFSFGYTGYLLAGVLPLNMIAVFGGVYALSCAAAVIGVVAYSASLVLAKQDVARSTVYGSALATVVLFSVALGGMYAAQVEPNGDPVHILAGETRFPSLSYTSEPTLLRDQTRVVNELVIRALSYEADIVLLPEDSRFTTLYADPDAALAALRLVASSSVVVDSSRWQNHEGSTVMRAFYYDLTRNSVHSVDKRYLVPQGEFVPYLVTMLGGISGMQAYIETLAGDQSYRAVPYREITDTARHPTLLFCFEGASPVLAQKVAQASVSGIVLHPVSHARFHGSSFFARHLDALLRVHALASGTTIVSAGNMTGSKVYRPDGSIEKGTVVEETPDFRLVEYTIRSR